MSNEELLQQIEYLRVSGTLGLSRSDLLGISGVSRLERVHMRVLAWLLRPNGPHGLGTTVIKGLFEKIEFTEALQKDLNAWTVAEEWSIGELGRVDLLLRDPQSRRGVVIEGKVDSGQQPNQRDRYVRGFPPPHNRHIYLTPSAEVLEAPWIGVTWSDVADIVRNASMQVTSSVSEWLETLNFEFGRDGKGMPHASSDDLDIYRRHREALVEARDILKRVTNEQWQAFSALKVDLDPCAMNLGASVSEPERSESEGQLYFRYVVQSPEWKEGRGRIGVAIGWEPLADPRLYIGIRAEANGDGFDWNLNGWNGPEGWWKTWIYLDGSDQDWIDSQVLATQTTGALAAHWQVLSEKVRSFRDYLE